MQLVSYLSLLKAEFLNMRHHAPLKKMFDPRLVDSIQPMGAFAKGNIKGRFRSQRRKDKLVAHAEETN